jgi:hypothetical protein
MVNMKPLVYLVLTSVIGACLYLLGVSVAVSVAPTLALAVLILLVSLFQS